MQPAEASESTICRKFEGGRYETLEVIGRGGNAVVFRARDLARSRDVALKQLTVPAEAKHRAEVASLFEREFRTLAELSHPSIIEVYDYGVEGGCAFYTMELVEGSDLREHAPLPWRQACALVAQVCSSLSLVHARGLVHRDISPRNVRTREGRAKLIDFGAMAPMGPSTTIVGTPAFVAPEVVLRSALDARTDLFSLGATLYFALTGRAAFPARDFSQLAALWRVPPELPSRIIDGIPEALDALVLSLLSLEPAQRPRTAAVVMQRLLAIAGVARSEMPEVSRAYLSAPSLVGRDAELSSIRADMAVAFSGAGHSVLIHAASGLGRSRLLDACVLEAKTSGGTVLRSTAGKGRHPFSIAEELAAQLIEFLPEASVSSARALGLPTQAAALAPELTRWLLHVAQIHPLAIVVDDVERIDGASGELLATLAKNARRARVLLLTTAEESALQSTDDAMIASLKASSRTYALGPLSLGSVAELLGSVFGDVPNLGVIADGIFAVSGGNPRVSMYLAQGLVDNGKATYEAGVWTLPASLESLELPSSAEETMRQRLGVLSKQACQLVQAQALASHEAFSFEQYALMAPESTSAEIDRAVLELIERNVLTTDGRHYYLSHRGWAIAVRSSLDDQQLRERHEALCRVYEPYPGIEVVHHEFAAGRLDAALDRLQRRVTSATTVRADDKSELPAAHHAAILERGLAAAIERGRPKREVSDLRRAVVGFSALVTEEENYYRAAPLWLEQLAHDSGYAAWLADPEHGDAGARLTRALHHALNAYAQTPERDRAYPVDEAIRQLVTYVVVSVAVGARTQDFPLIDGLPSLLEPFVPLSRVIGAIHKNASAGRALRVQCRAELARTLWIEVYELLTQIDDNELPSAELIRNAVASGIASAELTLGLPSADRWAASLQGDAFQAVHAYYMKRVVRLQQGDWDGAEQLRKQAEQRSIKARGRRMFTTSTFLELAAYGMAGDLVGVKEILDRMEPLARRFAGWVPWRTFAEAELQRLRGDFSAALALYEHGLGGGSARTGRLVAWWPAMAQGYLDTLLALGRAEHARSFGLACLAFCEAHSIHFESFGIVRALALAEAKLGEIAKAAERLEHVIDAQRQLGVSGLHLGASYEARTRVAILAADEPMIEQFGRLTAREYRHGKSSPLGARYERLLNDARRSSAKALPQLSDFTSTQQRSEMRLLSVFDARPVSELVTQAMQGASSLGERAQRALALLCTQRAANGGHLFLVDGTEPTLVASAALPEPPPELAAWVAQVVARASDDGHTEIVSEDMQSADASLNVFRDSSGTAHDALLLWDSAGRVTALAVLVGATTPVAPVGGLAMQLGSCLR